MSDIKGQAVVKSPLRNTADSDSTKLLRVTRDGMLLTDYLLNLAFQGRVFVASDADQNDTVTGQTSFANTTPTFLLNVPTGTTAIPLFVKLAQAGSVAGAAIDIIIEIDDIAAYSSGGTSETVLCTRTDNPVGNKCALYSGATATAGYGVNLEYVFAMVQDVAAAVADDYKWHQFEWKPPAPIFLVGPASLKVFTYAGTTGPSWVWSAGWAEVPSSDLV